MIGGRRVAACTDVGGVMALWEMNMAVVGVVVVVMVLVVMDDVSPVDVEKAEERGIAECLFVGGEAAGGAAVVTAHVRRPVESVEMHGSRRLRD